MGGRRGGTEDGSHPRRPMGRGVKSLERVQVEGKKRG